MSETPSLIGIAEPLILAVDNGASNTRLQLFSGETPLQLVSYTTPKDYQQAIGQMGLMAEGLTDARSIDATGIAVAGKVADGHIVSAGELEEYGWCHLPFAQDVAASLEVSAPTVVVLNDCVAAAKAQQVTNRKTGDSDSGYVETIGTGLGGAGFWGDKLMDDEPGHHLYKLGALCGCGKDGCAEAYISGSGIERRYGMPAEDLKRWLWPEVMKDAVEIHRQLLERLSAMGFEPASLYFFGSVALKSPMFGSLRAHFDQMKDALPFRPQLRIATHGDDGGLVGAANAALELLVI